MQAFKVYISSTYRDLIQHRKVVRDFFRKFSEKFEVIGMEDYVADDITPVAKCIEDVERCDFYILILANRYGFIPESTAEFNNPGRLSVTHLEYEAACRTKKKIFAFIADNTLEIGCDENDPKDIKEWKQKQLNALKNDVRTKYLTHPEGFNSTYQLALMVAESMMKAGEKYADLLVQGAQQLIERYIDEKRMYCVDRSSQYDEYKYRKMTSKSPFKVILIQGDSDSLAESLQIRITDVILRLEQSKIQKISLNAIFGTRTPEQYEAAKLVFLNVKFQELFGDSLNTELKSVQDFVDQLKAIKDDNRIAFVLNWETLSNGVNDPRIKGLQNLLHEFYEACKKSDCHCIYFFLTINYGPDNEKSFDEVVTRLLEKNPPNDPYIISLGKMDMIPSEDVGLWIDNYITEVPLKKRKIINKYLNLKGQFPMILAQDSIYDFIRKVNAQDPEALNTLN
jgi:hypothetical protein